MSSGPSSPGSGWGPSSSGLGSPPGWPEALPPQNQAPVSWDGVKAVMFAFQRMRASIEGTIAICVAQLFVAMPSGAIGGFTAYRTFSRMMKAPFPAGFVVPKPELIDLAVTQGATVSAMLLEGVVGGGIVAISLAMARGQSPSVSDIFQRSPVLQNYWPNS